MFHVFLIKCIRNRTAFQGLCSLQRYGQAALEMVCILASVLRARVSNTSRVKNVSISKHQNEKDIFLMDPCTPWLVQVAFSLVNLPIFKPEASPQQHLLTERLHFSSMNGDDA